MVAAFLPPATDDDDVSDRLPSVVAEASAYTSLFEDTHSMPFRSFWLLTVTCNSRPQAEDAFRVVARALDAGSIEATYTNIPAKPPFGVPVNLSRRPQFEIRFVLDHPEEERDAALGRILGQCQPLSSGWQIYFASGGIGVKAQTGRIRNSKKRVTVCWFLESGDTVLFPTDIAG